MSRVQHCCIQHLLAGLISPVPESKSTGCALGLFGPKTLVGLRTVYFSNIQLAQSSKSQGIGSALAKSDNEV